MSLAARLAGPKSAVARIEAACRHCGQPIAAGAGGIEFCCNGCAGAYAFVRELGLERYYAGRSLAAGTRPPRPPEEPAEDTVRHAVRAADGTCSLMLLIDGLHCAACVWLIETALVRQPGTLEAHVNLTSRRLRLRWRGAPEEAARLADIVRRLGYRAVPFDPTFLDQGSDREGKTLLRALAVAGFAAANVMLLSVSVWAGRADEMGQATRDLMHWISALIALPAIAYAGRPFFRSAATALRAGRTNMDVPISLGVVLAAGISLFETIRSGPHAYFDSAITLLFFLLIGRVLDLRARGRARSAVEHLLAIAAQQTAVVHADGRIQRVAADAVVVGDTILVATGERITVDGTVLEGISSVDKSIIDGESLPMPVAPRTPVLAGMVNLAAPLHVSVTAVGDRTFLAEIIRLMEAAEQGHARLVALADRVARRYAPMVHGLALVTFLGWLMVGSWQAALLNAVAVLIITCPCALGLAVPVVQVVAGNRLMRRGILLKSATALERLAEIDTVVFDKTGTLTLGRLDLCRDEHTDPAALAVAAGLAAASRHPLSRALCRAVPGMPVLEGVEEHPGAGLSSRTRDGEIRLGSGVYCGIEEAAGSDGWPAEPELWLARPGRAPVRFVFRDQLRPEARETVAKLRRAGKRVLLLSGDRPAAVSVVAEAAGIAEWRATLSPAAKRAALDELAAAGARVLMVGDGLNDGPALAAAHASMSPASAVDVCQIAADAVFQGKSLAAVDETLRVARRSNRIVRQNLALAIAYNILAVPLAMIGQVTPLIAAAAMSSSSVLVVGNALRLARSTP